MKGESTRRFAPPFSALTLPAAACLGFSLLALSCLCLLLTSLCLDLPLLFSSRLVLLACLAKDKAALWFKCKEGREEQRQEGEGVCLPV